MYAGGLRLDHHAALAQAGHGLQRESRPMQLKKIVVPLVGLGVLFVAFRSYGWPGLAMVGGAIVMWGLLHFTRMMQVMKRAADRPIGHVASAVMLNAKLRPGVPLLHVMAMTRSIGLLVSPRDTQPELFRWTDTGGSYVTCEFKEGKLVRWDMVRPPPQSDDPAPPAPPPAAS